MLSYRHAFHAGNHADIIKHATLCLLLESLQKKNKPYTLLDTHAGAGVYFLEDERAVKTGETAEGIVKLLAAADTEPDAVPESLMPYLKLARQYEKDGKYPGSPEIMRNYLRQDDRLQLVELHNTEIDVLRVQMKKQLHDGRLGIHHRDGYQAAVALTPPEPRRGLLLMDPSYEVDSDYENVMQSIVETHRHWPVGVLCVWYPLLKRREYETSLMKRALSEAAAATPSSFLCAELCVDSPDRETGLYGSGMAIINPAWHLDEQLEQMLPWCVKTLAPETGSWNIEKALV